MNYLALCQKVHLFLRIGEETPGTQPTAVTAQTGVLAEIVQWVNMAHDDICREKTQWAFMRAGFSMTLALGDRTLTKAEQLVVYPDLEAVLPFVTRNGGYIGITPTGVAGAAEEVCDYIPYQDWQGNYDAAPLPTGQPRYFTITPDQGLEFDAVPERAYTVRAGYIKAVVPLTANGSLPMLPAHYHNVIVLWAIVKYYCLSRDGTRELQLKAKEQLATELTKLYNEQLPDVTL